MLAALLLAVIAAVIGFGLSWLSRQLPTDENSVVEEVNALLPQTQCGQCNYPGCRPYAEAVVEGSAEINQCPPGGEEGVVALAQLLGRDVIPLDLEYGEPKPAPKAFIREPECIGCTLCIQVCPVDAILGSSKMMHTVIANECTGCELCLPACPVDCIDLLPDPDLHRVSIA